MNTQFKNSYRSVLLLKTLRRQSNILKKTTALAHGE